MTLATIDDALAHLERVVEIKGADYVDPNAAHSGCRYFTDTADYNDPDAWPRLDTSKPECIVGHVIWLNGWPIDPNENEGVAVAGLSDLPVTHGARQVYEAAQMAQDRGETWGEALRAAHDTADALRGQGVKW